MLTAVGGFFVLMEGITTDWIFEFRVKHESVVWMNMSENISVT